MRKQVIIATTAVFILASALGCNPFVSKQRKVAVLTTTDHKRFSLVTEIDSGAKWDTFRILPRLGAKKTDIVMPELKDKPCDISVSVGEAAADAPGNRYTEFQYDFGESHPIFRLLRKRKNKVAIDIVFADAIPTKISFEVILFAEPAMRLP